MPPNPIVITFAVTKDFRARLFDRFKNAAFNKFRLKAWKEAFRLRVVLTVARCRQRLAKTVNIKQPSVFNWRLLAAAIRVNDRPTLYQTPFSGAMESIYNQLCGHPPGHRPPDDPSGEFILKSCQIAESSASQRQISDVANNDFSGCRNTIWRLFQQLLRMSEIVPWISCARNKRVRTNRRQPCCLHQRTDQPAPDQQAFSF